jgi:NTE family protein
LIQAHEDYWLNVQDKGKDDALVLNLEVYIIDVWPTKEENLPIDHDGVMDRNYDYLLSDKTHYDEKVANIVSDYVTIVKELIRLAKSKKISKTGIDEILSTR